MIPASLLIAAEAIGRREVVGWDIAWCQQVNDFDPTVTTFADTFIHYFDRLVVK